ncbi:MAG TPA: hypothetical protein DHW82_09020 [Spirochaetia bacterium]|nr:MAG: hypothetical protein A2Y41_06260 [Spirochaetes bacterium GWB1_36_13]HCL57131.1 hypothetical protein [Spirochaetia bacterium]
MKTKILFFALFLLSVYIYPQNTWVYRESDKILLYGGQPFPFYSFVLNSLGYFGFAKKTENIFQTQGWIKQEESSFPIQEGSALSPEEMKRGWVFSEKRPSNLSAEWIFFPEKKLWAVPESFFKLFRLWDEYFENIQLIDNSIYSLIEPFQFYRIETLFLNKKIKKVEIRVPDNFVLTYEKNIKKDGVRKFFILYCFEIPISKKNKTDWIQLDYFYTDGNISRKTYKIIYQKNTALSFS